MMRAGEVGWYNAQNTSEQNEPIVKQSYACMCDYG